MTSPAPAQPGELGDLDAIVPDYSRIGFRQLQALCKAREIPADGTGPQLIEKLRAWDAQHGQDIDLTAPEGTDEDDDLLADDPLDGDDTPKHAAASPSPTAHALAAPSPARATPEAPTGGGEAASAPPPEGHGQHNPTYPAATVVTAPGEQGDLPAGLDNRGRPTLAVRNGVVKVGEGHQGRNVRAYRREYPIGRHDITDGDHFRMIADTHAAAQADGYVTKGGIGAGERIGYAADAHGQRTVVYQVPLRREQ